MFRWLVAAKLNVLSGSDDTCIEQEIQDADDWMATYGPVGSRVRAISQAWEEGKPLALALYKYDKGMLCVSACKRTRKVCQPRTKKTKSDHKSKYRSHFDNHKSHYSWKR
jgi:hypothetical protein